MAKRDYYEVLGLSKGASADDIKSAYRKAALKWHPDRWVSGSEEEKKTAEANFKEASEAYSVLSDPDKKARYDQFGFAGMDGGQAGGGAGGFDFGGMDLNDLLRQVFGQGFNFGGGGGSFGGFESFFGGGRQSSGPRTYRGRDIRTSVSLTLEEIASGVEKEVSLERNRPCPDCQGRGAKNASDIKTCPQCNGSGQTQQVVNSLFGRTMTYTTCAHCAGAGKVVTNPCRSCGGTGLVRKRETVKVKIPAGVEEGMQLKISGEGHSAPNNGVNGDLLVVIKQTAHPSLLRDGNNLYYTQIISVMDAMLGTEISVPGIEGPLKVKIEPGTQSGTILRQKGKGLPSFNSYGFGSGKGDLYVKILVWIPRKLDRDQRKAFEAMRDEKAFTPDLNRDDRELFDKEKTLF